MSERTPKSVGERFRGLAQRIDKSRLAPYLRGAAHVFDIGGTLTPHIGDYSHSARRDADAIRSDWENAIDQYEELIGVKSPLEMTAEEIATVGTPPKALIASSGKTWAEVMTDEEVVTYLINNSNSVRNLTERADVDPFAKRALPTFERNLTLSIDYLSRVGRLPEEFRTDERK